MSRRQLTSKQHAFLEFLQGHLDDHRVWPTYREIVDHFAYRSPNSVTQNLQALSRKGFLERDRNGYRLVDHSGRDGTIAVRGTVRSGRIEADGPTERLSLAALFSDLVGLHALRLDEGVGRGLSDLDEAQYVLVDEGEVSEGDTAVVLDGDTVVLARMGTNGQPDADDAGPGAVVVGRYAGHAGAYGIVRTGSPAPPRPVAASADGVPEGVAVLMAAEAQADASPSLSAPAAEALALAQPAAEA
jgi:repressor LexA